MKTFEEQIDDLIEGIKIGYGSGDTHWSSIDKTVRLLEFLRNDLMELENFTEQGMEDLILKAINGD